MKQYHQKEAEFIAGSLIAVIAAIVVFSCYMILFVVKH